MVGSSARTFSSGSLVRVKTVLSTNRRNIYTTSTHPRLHSTPRVIIPRWVCFLDRRLVRRSLRSGIQLCREVSVSQCDAQANAFSYHLSTCTNTSGHWLSHLSEAWVQVTMRRPTLIDFQRWHMARDEESGGEIYRGSSTDEIGRRGLN